MSKSKKTTRRTKTTVMQMPDQHARALAVLARMPAEARRLLRYDLEDARDLDGAIGIILADAPLTLQAAGVPLDVIAEGVALMARLGADRLKDSRPKEAATAAASTVNRPNTTAARALRRSVHDSRYLAKQAERVRAAAS